MEHYAITVQAKLRAPVKTIEISNISSKHSSGACSSIEPRLKEWHLGKLVLGL
jgi:hypothetical protein